MQEEVVGTRDYNLQQSYSCAERVGLFSDDYTGNIQSVLFEGVRRGVFSAAKFDSRPELVLARVLETDTDVQNWLRPAPQEFNITYNHGHNYEPDFVVETDDTIYLVEVKGEDKLSDPDVIAKKKRGIQYCKVASRWGKANGYKQWRYLFIPSKQVMPNAQWSDKQILDDLQNEVKRVCASSRNWTEWSDTMEQWIADIVGCDKDDSSTIVEAGSILPPQMFESVSANIQSLCEQINASYEHNLYGCTAVIMRRLLEGLLVLAYQNHDIESEIKENSGWHFTLDKIIKNTAQNKKLALSANTKKDMPLFKDIGNFSAHKIWYNSTKQDIESHI